MNISILYFHIYIYTYKYVYRNNCCAISQACLHNFVCRQNVWQSQEAAERQLVFMSSLNTCLFGLAEDDKVSSPVTQLGMSSEHPTTHQGARAREGNWDSC